MPPNVVAPAAVLRFAPSPNGALHLGHAYSALRNEQVAAEMQARLLLRIEDLDQTRCKPEYERRILDDLAWLGLQFEEPLRRQSEHPGDYDAALDGLRGRGLAYACFCSRAEVAGASVERDPDGAPVYVRTCRALPADQVGERLARGDKAVWRLDMPLALVITPAALGWSEFGEGSVPIQRVAEPERWGDVVLRGRDLAASYHLAVTVDDALQGVTDVVRGRDLLAATSVHRLLQVLLGLPAPRYRHHRLVLDANAEKLSKSRQSPSLGDLRRAGLTPFDVRAALGFAGRGGARIDVRLS
jgi:glutamyl-Q tRNA(Asp) synthetase